MTTTRPIKSPGARIGLLGGSFNPAHEGHVHISEIALRSLALDQIWWLVSPQNPLKGTADMASFDKRFESARQVGAHPRIYISDWEKTNSSTFTSHTIARLTRENLHMNFVWLMGADNLSTFHKWKDWQRIMELAPVAVIARPGSIRSGLASPAAQRYASARIAPKDARFLAHLDPPAWVFLQEQHHPLSSTKIREHGKQT